MTAVRIAALSLVFAACQPGVVPASTSYRQVECSRSPTTCFDLLRRSCPRGFFLLTENVRCGVFGNPYVPGPVPWYTFEASCYPTSTEPEPPYNPCYVR